MALNARHDGPVGRRLAHARSVRGVDLDRASAETRIDRRYIEALESNAGPREFPGPMYAPIFLREYARYLGLNPKPLVSAYRAAHPDIERPLFGSPPSLLRSPRQWTKPFVWLVSIAGLSAIVVVNVRSEPDVLAPVRDAPAPASPIPAILPTADPSAPPADPALPIQVRLEVIGAPSWIRVSQGETVLVEGTEAPGYTKTVLADDDLDVVLGNAGAVRLSLDGRELPLLGVEGEVYAGHLVVRDGRARLVGVP
jgi:cytoskeleton protein RodZ